MASLRNGRPMDLSDFCYARTRSAPRQALVRWAELRGATLRILEERPGADGGGAGEAGQKGASAGGGAGGGGGGKAGRTRARAVWDHVLTGAKVTPTWGRNEITIKLDADKLVMTLRNEDEFRRWRDGIAWAATTVEDFYTIVGSKQLHRGKTSEVVVGMDRSSPMSEVVAVKVINRAKAGAERAVAEMRLAVHVAHPRIIPVYDVRETLFDVFLVQQRAPGGNLYHSVQRSGLHVGLEDVRHVLRGLLQALAYLHGRGVVHGAVQLTNVLLGVSPGATCFQRPEPEGAAAPGGGAPPPDSEAPTDPAADGPGDVTASATTEASAATFAAVRAAAEAGLLGSVAPPPSSNGGAAPGSVDVPRPSLGRPDAASVAALRARAYDGWANHIKLCDLGHGAYLPRCPGEVLHRLDETLQLPYLAPEILHTPTRAAQGWGTPADLWAVGVCGFWLLTRCFPYPGTSAEVVLGGIEGGPPSAADPRLMDHLPDDGGATLSLLRQLLCVDPVKRLTAQAALQHRWFSPPASATTADGGVGLGHRLSASVSRAGGVGVAGGDDDGDRGRSSSLLGGTLESGRASSVSRVSSEVAAASAVAPSQASAAASASGWRSASTERPVMALEGVPSMRYGRVSSMAGLGMDATDVGKPSPLDGVAGGGKPLLVQLFKAAVTAVTAARRLRIFALLRLMEERALAGDPLLSSAAPESSPYGNGAKWATAPESPPAVPVVDASFLVPDRAEVQPQEVRAPAVVTVTNGNDSGDGGDDAAPSAVGQRDSAVGAATALVTSTEGPTGSWLSGERASTEAAQSNALSGRSSRTPSTSVAASDRGDDRADGEGAFLFSAPASGAGSRPGSISSSKGPRSRNRRSFVGLVRSASKVVENLQAHPPQHYRTPQGYPRSTSSTGGGSVSGAGGRGVHGNGLSSVSLARDSDAGLAATVTPASPRSGGGTMFHSSPSSPRGVPGTPWSQARRGVGRSLSYARDRSAADMSSRGGRDAAAAPPSADRSSINSTASGRGAADRGSLSGRSTALVRSASTAPVAGSDITASSGSDSLRDARSSTARPSSAGMGGNGLPRNSSVRGTNEVAYGARLPGTVIMGRTTVSRDARELLSAAAAGGGDRDGGGGRDLLITRTGSAAVLTPAGAAATAAAAAGRRSSTVAAQTAATAAFEAVAAARVTGTARPDRGRAGGGGRTTVAGEEKVAARKGGRQAGWLKKVRAFGFGMGGGGDAAT